MITIAPSLLSADFADLKHSIARVEEGGADWLHLDVMDGHFVPNLTFGPPVIRSIRKVTRLPLDVHLMIEDADRYLADFRSAGADIITVHYEACRHLHRTVQAIAQLGAKAGVCINPATPVHVLSDILQDVDLVLVMSVNPGFGGQSFIPRSLDKLRQASVMISGLKPGVFLEVDGGIDETTAQDVVKAGATVLVSGNYVFGAKDIAGAVRTLRRKVEAST